MATPYNAALRELRMKHKSASTAHESCIQALTEAKLRGEQPSAEMIEREAQTLRAVNEARVTLLAAMAQFPGD